jgi:hypothetical protein
MDESEILAGYDRARASALKAFQESVKRGRPDFRTIMGNMTIDELETLRVDVEIEIDKLKNQ